MPKALRVGAVVNHCGLYIVKPNERILVIYDVWSIYSSKTLTSLHHLVLKGERTQFSH